MDKTIYNVLCVTEYPKQNFALPDLYSFYAYSLTKCPKIIASGPDQLLGRRFYITNQTSTHDIFLQLNCFPLKHRIVIKIQK